MADPAALTRQELVDRLVQAVEEEDVLYTVVWLQEMGRRGLVCHKEGDLNAVGINLEHSWKKRSALVAAVSAPPTRLRQFILTLLLLYVHDVISCTAMSTAIALRTIWAVGVLNSWQSPAVQGTAIVRTPRELLAVSPAEVAEWIDANLPPHPAPNSLTGCGPLPSPPPQTRAPSASQNSPNTTTSVPAPPPASFVAPTAGLAARQVRLCEIVGRVHVDRLGNMLPQVAGLVSKGPTGKNAMLLTFESVEAARNALLPLQGNDYFRAAVLESVFQTASQADPRPSTYRPGPVEPAIPLPPLPFGPSSSSAPSPPRAVAQAPAVAQPPPPTPLPPVGWSPPVSQQAHGVRVHIGYLPVDVTREEVESLLAFAGVAYWALSFKKRHNRTSAYFTVSRREEYSHVSSILHNSHFRGFRLHVERQASEHISAEHPLVVICNLPYHWGLPAVEYLRRLTRLSAYGEAMQPLEDGLGIGRFRCSSPASAQETVDMLNGTTYGGITIDVEWTNGDGNRCPGRSHASTALDAKESGVVPPAKGDTLSQASANSSFPSAAATRPLAAAALQDPAPLHVRLPPSLLSTPAPETPSQPEPFTLPASSFATEPSPSTFAANYTPPVSPAIVTDPFSNSTGDPWGQELQGRRKASLDECREEERAAKRRK